MISKGQVPNLGPPCQSPGWATVVLCFLHNIIDCSCQVLCSNVGIVCCAVFVFRFIFHHVSIPMNLLFIILLIINLLETILPQFLRLTGWVTQAYHNLRTRVDECLEEAVYELHRLLPVC